MHAPNKNSAEKDLQAWVTAKAKPYEILLIDDDPLIYEAVVAGSENFNRRITSAFSGEEGLHNFRVKKPDMIWLDVRMPGMDGIDVFRAIRKEDPSIPVVIVAGRFTEWAMDQLAEIGISLMLRKPNQINEQMVRIVMRHFNVSEIQKTA